MDGGRAAVDRRLAELAPDSSGAAGRLNAAARYALLAPGKRLRPLLAVAAARQFGGTAEAERAALDAGCAIEMVHAASLMLDDLPSMDDATLRRGRPTVHLAFGEDLAVLGAVALLSHAFGVMACVEAIAAERRLRLVGRLSEAAGFDGLSGGQTRDLHERAPGLALDAVEQMNAQKTGVLFALSAEAGALCAGAEDGEVAAARAFGDRLGAAFQVRDDLLDLRASPEALGKDVGRDGAKPTVAALLGPEAARARADAALRAALAEVGSTGPLAGWVGAEFGVEA